MPVREEETGQHPQEPRNAAQPRSVPSLPPLPPTLSLRLVFYFYSTVNQVLLYFMHYTQKGNCSSNNYESHTHAIEYVLCLYIRMPVGLPCKAPAQRKKPPARGGGKKSVRGKKQQKKKKRKRCSSSSSSYCPSGSSSSEDEWEPWKEESKPRRGKGTKSI